MKTSTARRSLAMAVAALVTLGTSACGSDEGPEPAATTAAASATTSESLAPAAGAPTSAEIVDKVRANTLAATSATVTGQVADPDGDIDLVLKGTEDGSKADVQLRIEGKGEARLIVIGDTLYMKGDDAFWEAQGAAQMVELAGGKYVKVPVGEMSGMFEGFTISSLTGELFKDDDSIDVSDEVGEESVDGVDCWVLTSDSRGAKMYVSKGDFMLVRIQGPEDEGQFDFSGWDEPLDVTAPAANEVVDLG